MHTHLGFDVGAVGGLVGGLAVHMQRVTSARKTESRARVFELSPGTKHVAYGRIFFFRGCIPGLPHSLDLNLIFGDARAQLAHVLDIGCASLRPRLGVTLGVQLDGL
jgi:hypothetical protein